MVKIRRILKVMTTVARQRLLPRKTNKRRSPYASFIIQRNNYGKRQEKSMVGKTIIVRPSWSEKGNEKQEE